MEKLTSPSNFSREEIENFFTTKMIEDGIAKIEGLQETNYSDHKNIHPILEFLVSINGGHNESKPPSDSFHSNWILLQGTINEKLMPLPTKKSYITSLTKHLISIKNQMAQKCIIQEQKLLSEDRLEKEIVSSVSQSDLDRSNAWIEDIMIPKGKNRNKEFKEQQQQPLQIFRKAQSSDLSTKYVEIGISEDRREKRKKHMDQFEPSADTLKEKRIISHRGSAEDYFTATNHMRTDLDEDSNFIAGLPIRIDPLLEKRDIYHLDRPYQRPPLLSSKLNLTTMQMELLSQSFLKSKPKDCLLCPICLKLLYLPVKLLCDHHICLGCLKSYLTTPIDDICGTSIGCPICKNGLRYILKRLKHSRDEKELVDKALHNYIMKYEALLLDPKLLVFPTNNPDKRNHISERLIDEERSSLNYESHLEKKERSVYKTLGSPSNNQTLGDAVDKSSVFTSSFNVYNRKTFDHKPYVSTNNSCSPEYEFSAGSNLPKDFRPQERLRMAKRTGGFKKIFKPD